MTRPSFQMIGKAPVRMIPLYRWVRVAIVALERWRSMVLVIWSPPGAFLGYCCRIARVTMSGEKKAGSSLGSIGGKK